MAYSEDHIALAAEYALGTLDADERAQVETMMAVDTEFTAVVHAWEYRLGVLNQMVGSVEPRPIVWENIGRRRPFPGRRRRWRCRKRRRRRRRLLPSRRSCGAATEVLGRGQFKRDPAVGSPAALAQYCVVRDRAAAALIAMLALQVYQPELLPAGSARSRARKWSRSRRRRRRSSPRRNMSRCCSGTAARRRSS